MVATAGVRDLKKDIKVEGGGHIKPKVVGGFRLAPSEDMRPKKKTGEATTSTKKKETNLNAMKKIIFHTGACYLRQTEKNAFGFMFDSARLLGS